MQHEFNENLDQKETDHIISVWFISTPGADWMAKLWVREGVPMGCYRFRYYKDEKTFGSEDEKHWYAMRAPKDSNPDELAAIIENIASHLPDVITRDMVEVNGDVFKMLELLADRPWSHVQGPEVQA